MKVHSRPDQLESDISVYYVSLKTQTTSEDDETVQSHHIM
jgi:hypothetical protein